MAFFIGFLGITLFAVRDILFYPTVGGFAAVVFFLIILWKTRRYEVIAILFSLVGTFLCQFTLLYFTDEYHMVDVMWILVITLYTFFMLGKTWGLLILGLNALGILIFVSLFLNTNLNELSDLSDGYILALNVNFIISTSLISFLIFQFLNVIKIAENDFRQMNRELKDQNETIAFQNKEKTVMLKEIHHRVKNNLQVITSLLRLQSAEIKDSKSKEKFDETINRVISMALIHERMYQSEKLSKIDLKGYLEALAEELIHSYNIEKKIELRVECELQEIHPKSLVSVALIFNELISNSLKHAFDDCNRPMILINLSLASNQEVKIHYSDNGNWKQKNETSFGLELIATLCEQLGGTYNVETTDGTHYEFIFSKKGLLEEDDE